MRSGGIGYRILNVIGGITLLVLFPTPLYLYYMYSGDLGEWDYSPVGMWLRMSVIQAAGIVLLSAALYWLKRLIVWVYEYIVFGGDI
jgi:hypothetical protein